jgi:hypothetical protein
VNGGHERHVGGRDLPDPLHFVDRTQPHPYRGSSGNCDRQSEQSSASRSMALFDNSHKSHDYSNQGGKTCERKKKADGPENCGSKSK